MAITAETGSQVSGAISSIGGIFESIAAFKQQYAAAKRMSDAAEKEMEAIGIQGEEAARGAVQRAYAALEDSRFLSDVTQANIRYIRDQEASATGTTIAQAAGSGLEFIGSPVLVATEVSLQANRMIQNQRLTEAIGVRRFEFEVEKELRTAGLARQSADIAIESTALMRGAQIGSATFDAFKSLTSAGNQVTSILNSDGFRSILSKANGPAIQPKADPFAAQREPI